MFKIERQEDCKVRECKLSWSYCKALIISNICDFPLWLTACYCMRGLFVAVRANDVSFVEHYNHIISACFHLQTKGEHCLWGHNQGIPVLHHYGIDHWFGINSLEKKYYAFQNRSKFVWVQNVKRAEKYSVTFPTFQYTIYNIQMMNFGGFLSAAAGLQTVVLLLSFLIFQQMFLFNLQLTRESSQAQHSLSYLLYNLCNNHEIDRGPDSEVRPPIAASGKLIPPQYCSLVTSWLGASLELVLTMDIV